MGFFVILWTKEEGSYILERNDWERNDERMKEELRILLESEEFLHYMHILGFVLLVSFIIIGIVFFLKHHRRIVPEYFDTLEGHEFEHYCAGLLQKKGFIDVEVTKGSGDYGVDILAEKDGVTYAIQCKCYTAPIGVKAIQEAYAGRDYYDRMVGAVLTNQYFTTPAVEAAKKLKILLWDRGYLESMLEEEE